jgi:hypothetical protein
VNAVGLADVRWQKFVYASLMIRLPNLRVVVFHHLAHKGKKHVHHHSKLLQEMMLSVLTHFLQFLSPFAT